MFTGPHCFLLTFPLLLLVIPFSREALHWTDSHVQHLLELFLFVLGVKCVWHRAKHCKQSNAYFRRHDKLAPDFEVFMSNRIAPIGPILKITTYQISSARTQLLQKSPERTGSLQAQSSTQLSPESSLQSFLWSWCGTLNIKKTHGQCVTNWNRKPSKPLTRSTFCQKEGIKKV